MKPEDFINEIAQAAQQSALKTKVPASFVIAEGALESGWGASMLATKGMNLFGVKADASWKGATISINTREFLRGKWVMVPALWRQYSSWLDCISDHASFLLDNERYKPAFAHSNDALAFTKAVAAAGYATDPNYASKIIAVINANKLIQLDRD